MIIAKLVQNDELVKIPRSKNPFIFVVAQVVEHAWWLGKVQRIRRKVGNGWGLSK
jgi:hypothetical protein